jgi:hypothetical protein
MQLGFKNYAAYGGDPVNFATGNLVELEDLFHVTGPGGSDTQVALVYNSQDGRVTRFGTGWTSDLTARAQRFADGSVAPRSPSHRTGSADTPQKPTPGPRWRRPVVGSCG